MIVPELSGTDAEFRARIASAPASEAYRIQDFLSDASRHPCIMGNVELAASIARRLGYVVMDLDARWRGLWFHRDNIPMANRMEKILKSSF
ncbi:hypothetical protein SEA_DMPSTRDIVER_219 [Mycobacterium phage DmpstrDiver]|nr:hypothetical protein SEA_DMPSTRDIVER_219 [Mycobacterium phage DmpstrDiver]